MAYQTRTFSAVLWLALLMSFAKPTTALAQTSEKCEQLKASLESATDYFIDTTPSEVDELDDSATSTIQFLVDELYDNSCGTSLAEIMGPSDDFKLSTITELRDPVLTLPLQLFSRAPH